jgi:serine/threonine protein kinase/tetratricopeptide (TPR) repeat protein
MSLAPGAGEAEKLRWQLLEDLLDQALDLKGDARRDFIARAAQTHPELTDEFNRLLKASDKSVTLLDKGPSQVADALVEKVEIDTGRYLGMQFGPWRVLDRLGQGGMGRVYLAERSDGAFAKKVALKLIRGNRPGLNERLDAEREMLAKLDHPGIARLIDGGASKSGQSFLVLEWVDGVDILRWCEQQQLGLDRRLDLFVQVCDAVAYAHTHLIVHRDIKPGNILIDRNGRAKLLDFGIAKLVGPDVKASATRNTALTPEYAAPEQLGGKPVTTRTDVYGLGVLLYRMLTGRAPHVMDDRGIEDFIYRVCNEPALAPSLIGKLPDVPVRRLRGDLDAILARALAPNPEQRYASVQALADDVRAVLRGDLVAARPHTLGYRSSRFLRRHWLASATVIVLLSGLTTLTVLLAREAQNSSRERDLAMAAQQRAESMRDALMLMFRDIRAPSLESGEIGAADLFDRMAERVMKDHSDQPDLQLSMLATLGGLYTQLGDFAAAAPLLERAVTLDASGLNIDLRLRMIDDLALSRIRLGKPAEALSLIEQTLSTLAADPARIAGRGALLTTRAQAERQLGQVEAALTSAAESLRLSEIAHGPDSREAAIARNGLGITFSALGRADDAAREFAQTFAIWERMGAAQSLDAANVLNNWAGTVYLRGRVNEAATLFERALAVRRLVSGPSGGLAALLTNLGRVRAIQGKLDESAALLTEAVRMQTENTGADTPDTASARLALGETALLRADIETAASELGRAHEVFSTKLGARNPATARTEAALARLFHQRGEIDDARQTLDYAIESLRKAGAPALGMLASALCERARVLALVDKVADATAAVDECLAIRAARVDSDSWEIGEALAIQAHLAALSGDGARATALSTRARSLLEPVMGKSHPRLVELWIE